MDMLYVLLVWGGGYASYDLAKQGQYNIIWHWLGIWIPVTEFATHILFRNEFEKMYDFWHLFACWLFIYRSVFLDMYIDETPKNPKREMHERFQDLKLEWVFIIRYYIFWEGNSKNYWCSKL